MGMIALFIYNLMGRSICGKTIFILMYCVKTSMIICVMKIDSGGRLKNLSCMYEIGTIVNNALPSINWIMQKACLLLI